MANFASTVEECLCAPAQCIAGQTFGLRPKAAAAIARETSTERLSRARFNSMVEKLLAIRDLPFFPTNY